MEKKSLIIFIIIFLLGAGLRIGYFYLNSYNMDVSNDEPWSKINLAMRWIYSDRLLPDLNFGPLHTYLISALWLLNKEEVVILSRLFSLIFGILFILLYFWLLRELFNVKVAYAGTFLLSIYPLHIHLSSTSLAEVPAYFFLFSALYFLYVFINQRKVSHLVISAIALNLSAMLRFESWIFILLFSGILFLKKLRLRYTLTFLILSFIFPVIWMVLNYKYEGNPINFIMISSKVSASTMEGIPLFDRLWGFPYILCETLSFPICICCFFGFASLLVTKRKKTIFIFLFVFSLFIYALRSIRGNYDYSIARYSLLLGLLFIPFGAIAFEYIFALRKHIKLYFLIFCTAVFLCTFYSMETLNLFNRKIKIPETLTHVTSWMSANINKDDKIILETGIYHPFIILNVHLYPDQVIEYNHFSFYENKKSLGPYINDSDYIVICRTEGRFREMISEIKDVYSGEKVFGNADWEIFERD